MKAVLNYFFLQLKRSLAAFSRMMGSVIVMIALSILLAWGVSRSFSNVQMLEQVTLAVVLSENEDETEMILDLISGMPSVESVCTFVYLPKEEAFEKLKRREIEAAIVLPENFYDDVNHGTNTPLTIYFSADVDLDTSMFKELLYDGVSFVRVTESAIYSVVDMRDLYELKMSKKDTYAFLSEFYLWHVFGRGEAFQNHVLSATGEVNLVQYYITVGVFLFLLLGSLTFGFLYKEEEQILYKKLRLMGIGSSAVAGSRVIIMSVYAYVAMLLTWIVGIITGIVREKSLFSGSVLVPILLILPAFAMAAFCNLIYSLAKNQTQGMLITLAVNAFMLICAGGLLPLSYFPKGIRMIGEVLPLRLWMESLQRIYFGKSLGAYLWIAVALGIVCYGISIVITEHKK